MIHCRICAAEVPPKSRFCPSCGSPTGSSGIRTATGDRGTAPEASNPPAGGHLDAQPEPGAILAGRYRILGRLGRGGMGEVLKADDLKLGQVVALKLLPSEFASNPGRIVRFHNEVRLARQVSHPNVCRVYDIGESEGRHFISMEYVDGEDLSSLLRRIGRLPEDKAVDIARQLCAGLTAAHDRGVLHHDLKPSNVMIDSKGKARITDFGLAGLAVDLKEGGSREGTPYYMAPEQLAGKGATISSEIYSLGLVLYEMLTGKPPYAADTIAGKSWSRTRPALITPGSLQKELDPALERVVLMCLEHDPALRPASALMVAAALPGADPLAAALAAGDTPSPEMVAAAGSVGQIRSAVGWLWLGLVFAGLIVLAAAGPGLYISGRVPLDHRPQVLQNKAREMLNRLGHHDAPGDIAVGFATDGDALRAIQTNAGAPGPWERLGTGRPAVLRFWYRQSPRSLEPVNFFVDFLGTVSVSPDDPPPTLSGMVGVQLDTRGRLVELLAVPPQVDKDPGPGPEPQWDRLFAESDLDPGQFEPTLPEWLPPSHSDSRRAWVRSDSTRLDLPDRVEAAAWRGTPVYFQMIWPWTRPARMQPVQQVAGQRASQMILLAVFVAVLVGGGLVARHNMGSGRGDRRGAMRLAIFVILVLMLHWVLSAGHVLGMYELALFIMGASGALFGASLVWLLYLALEPNVRRRWPWILISWSRLLAGRIRDPLVGRDLFAGTLLGIGMSLFVASTRFVMDWSGLMRLAPAAIQPSALMGMRFVMSDLLLSVPVYLFSSLAALFLLLLLRIMVRKNWLAGLLFVLIFAAYGAAGSRVPAYGLVVAGVLWTTILLVLTRLGLLALVACFCVLSLTQSFLLTLNPSDWWAPTTWFAMAVAMALAVFAFRAGLGSRPLFSGALLNE